MDNGQEAWQPIAVWVTKDKQHIPITELEGQHLENIVKMLIRQAHVDIRKTQSFYLSCPMPHGEMAQDAFDAEFDFWCDDGTMENEVRVSRLEATLRKSERWQVIEIECVRRGKEDLLPYTRNNNPSPF